MPQLSPLNWIFLFFLAWSSIFLMFMVIWWESKVEYSAENMGAKSKKVASKKAFSWRW